MLYASILGKPNDRPKNLQLEGIDEKACYKEINTDKVYGGDVLVNIGLPIKFSGDFNSEMMIFERVE